ncbi:hypothetical protein JR334_07695 [Clostridia bacterium]|nr:hypothetical protein JR334_07695 [Clostridia bacterium]
MSRNKRALEVVENMKALATSIAYLVQAIEAQESAPEDIPEITEKAVPKTKNVKKRKVEEQPEDAAPTLEEVRALMAEKNRDGHREAVKAIINKYGAEKLTSLDTSYYEQVLEEVGELK